MIRRLFPRLTTSAWWFICLESLAIAAVNAFGQDQSPAPLEKFKTLAQRLAAEPADDCHRDSDRWPSGHPEELESELFDQANKFLCGSLNSDSRQGLIAADEALKTLRSISDDLHHNWPEYRRFRYEILDEAPLILVKITFRSRAIATAFAVPNEAYGTERVLKPNAAWQANRYFEGNGWDRGGGEQSIDLYPLARGASKRARYLIKLTSTGCGSGIGVEYTAYEWNPEGAGSFDQLLHRKLTGRICMQSPRQYTMLRTANSGLFGPTPHPIELRRKSQKHRYHSFITKAQQ